MNLNQSYRSCFIIDVKISDKEIILQDSVKNFYYIDTTKKETIRSFKNWFKTIFLKGKSQTLTIFKYINIENDGVIYMYIEKFII